MKHTLVAFAALLLSLNLSHAIAADVTAGKKAFKKCTACHSIEAGVNKLGPSMFGVVGRKAATEEGFKYSKALLASGIVWNYENLDAYIKKPRSLVKGTRMSFAGLRKQSQRDDLFAYLETLR